jgi:hypothetical protein
MPGAVETGAGRPGARNRGATARARATSHDRCDCSGGRVRSGGGAGTRACWHVVCAKRWAGALVSLRGPSTLRAAGIDFGTSTARRLEAGRSPGSRRTTRGGSEPLPRWGAPRAGTPDSGPREGHVAAPGIVRLRAPAVWSDAAGSEFRSRDRGETRRETAREPDLQGAASAIDLRRTRVAPKQFDRSNRNGGRPKPVARRAGGWNLTPRILLGSRCLDGLRRFGRVRGTPSRLGADQGRHRRRRGVPVFAACANRT